MHEAGSRPLSYSRPLQCGVSSIIVKARCDVMVYPDDSKWLYWPANTLRAWAIACGQPPGINRQSWVLWPGLHPSHMITNWHVVSGHFSASVDNCKTSGRGFIASILSSKCRLTDFQVVSVFSPQSCSSELLAGYLQTAYTTLKWEPGSEAFRQK